MKNITRNFIVYLIAMSILIFTIGTYEVMRSDYMFDFTETYILKADYVPTHLMDNYFDFKNDLLFTNSYFVDFVNWIGIIGLFYIFVAGFREGYNASPLFLKQIFIKFNLLLILIVYIILIIFNYLSELFINTLIVDLFNDIYNSIYIFKIFYEYFIWLYLFAIFLNWFANQIKYFEVFNR